jgi:hypothetical protein
VVIAMLIAAIAATIIATIIVGASRPRGDRAKQKSKRDRRRDPAASRAQFDSTIRRHFHGDSPSPER